MLCRDPVSVLFDEVLSGHADQIGHLPLRWLHLLVALVAERERVQRAGGSAEMTLRKMKVDGGFLQIVMSQQYLDSAQVSPGFQ